MGLISHIKRVVSLTLHNYVLNISSCILCYHSTGCCKSPFLKATGCVTKVKMRLAETVLNGSYGLSMLHQILNSFTTTIFSSKQFRPVFFTTVLFLSFPGSISVHVHD